MTLDVDGDGPGLVVGVVVVLVVAVVVPVDVVVVVVDGMVVPGPLVVGHVGQRELELLPEQLVAPL